MAGPDFPTPALDAPPPDGDAGFGYSYSYRNAWKAAAVTLATLLVELALLQLFAVGATTGIYHLAPQLDAGSPRGFRDWLSILQVVSATLTLPGGAAMVLSSWMAYRWGQASERHFEAAEQRIAAVAEQRIAGVRAESAQAIAEIRAEAAQNAVAAQVESEVAKRETDRWQEVAMAAQAAASAAQAEAAAAREAVASLQAQAERRRGRGRRRRLRR